MNRVAWLAGVLCIVVAVVVFLFADGLRRWYSGIFFTVLGAATLWGAGRSRGGTAATLKREDAGGDDGRNRSSS